MKKKILFCIFLVAIMIFSGVMINTNHTKNSTKEISINKKIEKENSKNTTWQEDYIYKLDRRNGFIVLSHYKGKSTDITIPGKAILNGEEYKTMLMGSTGNTIFPGEYNSITIEDGVVFPPANYGTIGGYAKTVKIGKVDLSYADSLSFSFTCDTLDLSDFDTTELSRYEFQSGGKASRNKHFITATEKVIIGNKVELKKEFLHMTTYLEFYDGYWKKEGTDEIYSSDELGKLSDKIKTDGTYIKYEGSVISYNPNFITNDIMISQVMEENTKLRKNIFTRYGYRFNGWNTDKDGNGETYKDEDSISSNESLTLYAQWIKDESVTIPTPTKELKLNYKFTKNEDGFFDESYGLVNFKLYLTLDNKTYTEAIQIKYNDEVKEIQPNKNGYYNIRLNNSEEPNRNISAYNSVEGVTLLLPENVEYKLDTQFNYNDSGIVLITDEDINGKLIDNISHNINAYPPTTDIRVLFYANGVTPEAEFNLAVGFLYFDKVNERNFKYTGTQSGEITIPKNYNYDNQVVFTARDCEFITIHDVPFRTYISMNANDSTKNIHFTYFTGETSGYFGSNGWNLLYFVENNNVDVMGLIKKGDSFGIEDKKFKFKITAYNKDLDEPLTGEYPYVIYTITDDNEMKIIMSDKITFNEEGIAYPELKVGEAMAIGAAPLGYKLYKDSAYLLKQSKILYDNNGVLTQNIEYTIEELEDENKYKFLQPITNSSLTYTYFYNSRNMCNLNFKKIENIKLSKLTYNSIKHRLPDGLNRSFTTTALTYKNRIIAQDISNIENYFDENTLKKIIENLEQKMNSKYDETKEYMLANYISSGEYLDNIELNQNFLNKTYDEFLVYNIKNDNSPFSQILNYVEPYKFKLTLNDTADLSNNNFLFSGLANEKEKITLDENNSYTFQVKTNYSIDSDEITTEFSANFTNLWCGMEYQIEEVDGDKYLHTDDNTKGILKKNDNDNITYASILNKGRNYNGELTLNKVIKGNISKKEEFIFNIELELDEDVPTEYSYTGSKEGTLDFTDGKATITLKGGESITIEGLPVGTKYKITEDNTNKYKVSKENDEGTITEETIVTFTNSNSIDVPKTLDNIIKFVVIAIGAIVVIVISIIVFKKVNKGKK